MNSEQIQNRIDALRRTAETGEDWANICALEDQRFMAASFESLMAGAVSSHQAELARIEWETT